MNQSSTTFEERARLANERILALRNCLATRLDRIPVTDRHPTLCIYATGSLARLEANPDSDLDAFFMLSGNDQDKPIGRIRDVKILNAVLEAAEETKFPDFSNDGQYLRFLHIESVVKHIGSREDDYINAFTARMLMLLESKYLYNENSFNEFRNKIIDVYFTDYHKHASDFRPIFLINDVLRFWRTLCINYENARHWRGLESQESRAKGHLGNLKLKFSRLNICYSFICHLLHQGSALTQENVVSTANLTPFERLDEVAANMPDVAHLISSMKSQYCWFLEKISNPKEQTLRWIDDEKNRNDAFQRAADFIGLTVSLTSDIAEKNGYLRYLIA